MLRRVISQADLYFLIREVLKSDIPIDTGNMKWRLHFLVKDGVTEGQMNTLKKRVESLIFPS